MRKILEACPSCGGSSLIVTEVVCATCGTQVRSRYQPGPFSALDEEQQTFLLLFVRSRGNLKDVEKTLGVSYPTVRAKLDEIVQRLEPPAAQSTPPANDRRSVLALVQSGQLSPDDALALLRTQSAASPASQGAGKE